MIEIRLGRVKLSLKRPFPSSAWSRCRLSGAFAAQRDVLPDEHRGSEVERTVRKAVEVGTARYAVIEKSKEFTLAPWRPVLEKQIGREVSGIDRGGSTIRSFRRQRPEPEIG